MTRRRRLRRRLLWTGALTIGDLTFLAGSFTIQPTTATGVAEAFSCSAVEAGSSTGSDWPPNSTLHSATLPCG